MGRTCPVLSAVSVGWVLLIRVRDGQATRRQKALCVMYLSQAHGGVGNIIQKGLEPFQEGKSGNCLDFYQGNFPGAETAWDTEQRALLGLEGREWWWSKSILTQAPVSLKFSSFPRECSRGCCTLLHGSGAWICSFQLLTWLWCILGLLMCDDFNMWVWKVIFSSSFTLLFRVSVTVFFWEVLLDWFANHCTGPYDTFFT